jgi:pimeloyl-ACP methyl ester carboxylesterase
MRKGKWLAGVIAIMLGATLVASAGARYGADLAQARMRITGHSQIAHTPCGRIEYAVVGDGVPLLFVHGAGGGFDQGLAIAHELAAQGIKVIVMSRFGYLHTPLPADASPMAQADAHACLLDALKIDRAVIAGASAGAPSATQFALRHPGRTRGLILLVPAIYAPRETEPSPPATGLLFDTALRSNLLFWAATRLARDTMIESILATPPAAVHAASADEQRRVHAILAQIQPVRSRRLGLLNDARQLQALPRYPLEQIGAPSLLISVKDDGYGTWDGARYTASQLPNARLIGYDSGGHVWVGHHQDVLRELTGFVKALPP